MSVSGSAALIQSKADALFPKEPNVLFYHHHYHHHHRRHRRHHSYIIYTALTMCQELSTFLTPHQFPLDRIYGVGFMIPILYGKKVKTREHKLFGQRHVDYE